MHSVRHVYPLAGFRILLAAYAESLRQEEPIDPREFVKRYVVTRFGLSARDGVKLWEALTPEPIAIQPTVDIDPILAVARKSRQLIASLDPRQHKNEFEHLRLVTDLREFHVRFKKFEREIQSSDFKAAQIPEKIPLLERLVEECEMLDQRFLKANRGFLYEKGLAEEIETRSKKLRELYHRLTRAARKSPKTAPGLLKFRRDWSWSNRAKRQSVKTTPTSFQPLTLR